MSYLDERDWLAPEGWHKHGRLCYCPVCEDKYDSGEYAFGEDDF